MNQSSFGLTRQLNDFYNYPDFNSKESAKPSVFPRNWRKCSQFYVIGMCILYKLFVMSFLEDRIIIDFNRIKKLSSLKGRFPIYL
jgi:hypothetical protein